MSMTFDEAARIQYRRHSMYVVFLVSPDGSREQIGITARKTGSGLMNVLRRDSVQEKVKRLPGALTATFKKHADRLDFSNGYKIVFGGTIRQESSEG